ncbi:MAG: hypothetical protein RDU20_03265 [Desulfomonilaceae bacterium]|nr:hypothetical protein [Desulfomonilaceae bacterium]
MSIEQGIDELIDAGWRVLYTDFEDSAVQDWKRKAAFCMNVLREEDQSDAEHTIPAHGGSSWNGAAHREKGIRAYCERRCETSIMDRKARDPIYTV